METTVGDFFICQDRAEGCDEDLSDIIEMAKGVARCSSMCVYLIDYATNYHLL